MGRRRDHAVVIGIAGLLAARVLADTYAAVTVLERDRLPDAVGARRGVPQGTQAHALQPRGQQILSELFPGITQDLIADGAQYGDTAADAHWYFGGVPLPEVHSGLLTVMSSRPFLDQHVWQRVGELPNVALVQGRGVDGLVATRHRERIVGVRLASGEVHEADLVVDASGRGSRTPVWLTELGYPRVREDRLTIGLGYATRRYRIGPRSGHDGRMIMVMAAPGLPRGAICGTIEDGQFVVTLSGMVGDHPRTDPAGFTAFARSLPATMIHDIVQDAEPLGDPVAYRFPASVRRRYDLMPRMPEGLLMVGDSVCSFNPVYAQGMSVAALGAELLRRHLSGGAPRPQLFLRDLLRDVVGPSWTTMALGDLAYAEVSGRGSARLKLTQAYWSRLWRAATRDPTVADALLRVLALMDPFPALLRPSVAARVLRFRGTSRTADVAEHPDEFVRALP
jgi:2-polyprenyl-6-methoxyphenol hydroxylase-like FAD-dependent oxidoreductase